MLPFQRQQFHQVMNWVDRHPEARTMPGLVSSAVDRILRYDQVQKAQAGEITISLDPYELETIRDDLLSDAGSWSERREAEHEIAEYMREVASTVGDLSLVEQAAKHDECRLHGAVGLKPGGGTMIAWDSKCGSVRTCPDESREETQRLTEFYLPAMLDWVKQSPTHRIFYGVFTTHNYRAGSLASGKRHLLEKFKDWMTHQAEACPVRFWTQHGITHVVRSRKKKMPPTFEGIKGALVVQEDPLAAGGDWNVHLNVFLLVKGSFDFKQAREVWGANLHLQQIEGEAGKLRASLLEAIKYSAQFVPGKSAEKAQEGKTAAPAMTEWPHWRFYEWWQAQKGFRRVRSYGCLYALHGKRWNAMEARDRVDLCRIAEIDSATAGKVWKEIEEDPRGALREAMVHGERLDMTLVEWIGSVSFTDGAGYRVDLIPGDNFSSSRQKRTTFSSGAGVSSSGAPPPW